MDKSGGVHVPRGGGYGIGKSKTVGHTHTRANHYWAAPLDIPHNGPKEVMIIVIPFWLTYENLLANEGDHPMQLSPVNFGPMTTLSLPGHCLRPPGVGVGVGGLFGALPSHGRPTHPPTSERIFLRQKMKFIEGAGNLRPILGTPTFVGL